MGANAVVGQRLASLESMGKTTGEAKFADDLSLPGMLYGRLLPSTKPHARLLRIDTCRARTLPGVEAVITGEDIRDVKYGFWPPGLKWDAWSTITEDRYPLARGKVRFVGEEIAAVAAVDEDTAEKALRLIDVDYEELPSVFDPEEAMKPGAPRIHDREDNICAHVTLHAGDIEAGFAQADHIREDRFSFASVGHAAIEPHSALAYYDPMGNLTIWSSTQMITCIRSALSHTLGLPEDRIRVIAPCVGGAFGGKSGLFPFEFGAALLSMKTGRPVKITHSREGVFTSTTRRYQLIIRLRTGFKSDGAMVATQCRVIAEAGAYMGVGTPPLLNGAVFLNAPYRIPNLDYDGRKVHTNRSVCGPQRGPGLPQMRYAVESQLDLAATDLGLDPVEIRLRNALHAGEKTSLQWDITSCGLSDSIHSAMSASREAREAGNSDGNGRPRRMTGQGIACSAFMSCYDYPAKHASPASVRIGRDGSVTVSTFVCDFGQGADTGMRHIVAEELGIPIEMVRVRSGDSSLFPDQWWSFSDSASTGRAVQQAAGEARRQLLGVVSEELEVKVDDLEWANGRIQVRGSPERGMAFPEAALRAFDKRTQGAWGEAQFCAKEDMRRVGKRGPCHSYSFATQRAQVEVDRETGQVELKRIVNAYDCGRALNPNVVEGVLQGGATMGLGQALSEEMAWEGGQTLTTSFLDYRLPTALDAPAIDPILIETIDPAGPFGAKEVGQGSMQATAPAIGNAIYQALGVAIKDLPITPEKVLQALEEVGGG